MKLERFFTDDPTDAQIVRDLLVKHHNTPEDTLPTMEEIWKSDTMYFTAMLDDDTFVGMSAYRFITKSVVEKRHTFIFQEYRRRGYGSEMSKFMEEVIKEDGAEKILCYVYTWNHANLCLKIKEGFIFEGKFKDPGEEEYYALGKII